LIVGSTVLVSALPFIVIAIIVGLYCLRHFLRQLTEPRPIDQETLDLWDSWKRERKQKGRGALGLIRLD
jgi:hypothetical protein